VALINKPKKALETLLLKKIKTGSVHFSPNPKPQNGQPQNKLMHPKKTVLEWDEDPDLAELEEIEKIEMWEAAKMKDMEEKDEDRVDAGHNEVTGARKDDVQSDSEAGKVVEDIVERARKGFEIKEMFDKNDK
jgi:hypothetical protein